MSAPHDDRFALAVSAELPGFVVTNRQGMIVATLYREDGSRVDSFRVPNLTRGDKRKPVSREDGCRTHRAAGRRNRERGLSNDYPTEC